MEIGLGRAKRISTCRKKHARETVCAKARRYELER